MKSCALTHNAVKPAHLPGLLLLAWTLSLTMLLSACAGAQAPHGTTWLPSSAGWSVVDVDEAEPPSWVIYERGALVAHVKEFRIVGLINADAELANRALRFRLVDEQYIPKGLMRRTIKESESEVVFYGLISVPFPFQDREVTERYRFSDHCKSSGLYQVHAREVDTAGLPPKGVVRVPLIRNSWTIQELENGQSRLTIDTVHDIGNGFLNVAIYCPIRKQLVDDLREVERIATQMATRFLRQSQEGF